MPNTKWAAASHHPIRTSHTTLPTPVKKPASLGTTARPNGHRANPASLKACRPKGMPTMVIVITRPPIT